jgi:hypothetical protein
MDRHGSGETWKDVFNSRIMAEKYKSFGERNPDNVLSQTNVEVMMKISKQLLECENLSAETTRYEQAVAKTMLSGDVDAITYGDLESMEESLHASTFKTGMVMSGLQLATTLRI